MAEIAEHSSSARKIAVRFPLAGRMGEQGDRPVSDQAAQSVAARHQGRPGQHAVRRGVGAAALAVEGEGRQVECTAAQPELVPVHDSGDPCPVGQDVRQIKVVVGVVGWWQLQTPGRLEPAPQPRTQSTGVRGSWSASAHTSSQSSNSTFAT
jgi:hypothetical protein